MFHEIEEAVVAMKILKKEERDLMARSGKSKTLNDGPTSPHSTLVCVLQPLKTSLQNKAKTSLKTQKHIKTRARGNRKASGTLGARKTNDL